MQENPDYRNHQITSTAAKHRRGTMIKKPRLLSPLSMTFTPKTLKDTTTHSSSDGALPVFGIYNALFEESRSTYRLFMLKCRIEQRAISLDGEQKIRFAFDWFYLSGSKDAERLWRVLNELGVGDVEFDDLVPSVSGQLKMLQRTWRSAHGSLSQSAGRLSPTTGSGCRR